ncbi:TMEM165/GDT1 family protein [Castellaniella sp.]|uniref:TMEM165/GDT1 family protein n=1 Tax=Castellaniella sp. TaxID=1955812 RepID=UPI003A943D0A
MITAAITDHYEQPLLVVIGTTVGMLIVDVPADFVGGKPTTRVLMKPVHSVTAVIFLILSIITLSGAPSTVQV